MIENEINLTDEQFELLVIQVANKLALNSQGTSQVEIVKNLDGIYHLPATRIINDDETIVSAPIALLHGKELTIRVTDTAIQSQLGQDGWEDIIPLSRLEGKTAFQVWIEMPGNAGKTTTDYINYLREPATTAASAANDATRKANEAATNADQKAKSAEQATVAAGTATENADKAKEAASIATGKANTAAGNADTATDNAVKAIRATGVAIKEVETATENANRATGSANTATEKANQAANRLNDLSDHRDEIRDGYWWRWNEELKEWYNTGDIAKGNIMYSTFDFDPATGELSMYTDEEYSGPLFELDNNGVLSVII